MKNLCFSLLFIILWSSPGFSQEFTGRVLDLKTKNPVAYATIQYAKNRGVVTNEEGYFSINLPASNLDNLLVSSMGFETQEFKSSQLENNIIYLKSKVIQLEDIFLSNKKLTGEEILERAKSRVAENYNFNLRKKRFFFRESNVNKVNKFLLDIDESTIPDINQELMDSISESIPRYSDSYKEVLGDFYGDYSQQKIEIIKAANLFNPQSKTSLNKLTNRLDDIFKENVKKNSYLKIKSGLFGVKVDAEEIAEERKENVKEEKEKKKPTPEELANAENDRRKEMVNSTNENISSILKNTFWKEDGIFDLFDKLNRYKYEVEEYTYFDNEIVYVIAFEPKGRSEFRGRVYVNTSDFGVHRIDYTNVKPLKKFRLLG
ncbi:MAG: carboxypeptidase-like regulatory domain-containing protein, partial [Christiangramia sp.]